MPVYGVLSTNATKPRALSGKKAKLEKRARKAPHGWDDRKGVSRTKNRATQRGKNANKDD
ncbi:hypothetical protein PISMIDRAFT_678522, partial [Pisolithus microcarpus 441]